MKKFLSLVLALVMTMSLVTVSAGAKDFTDNSKLTYKEAVDVISDIGVVDGYTDGSFNPQNELTRGAAAKIICNLILGPTTAEALSADTAPYSDVPTTNTFAGYIAYCQQQGIISGYADGTFRPAASLTGYAFMKMLLGALGYDSEIEGFTGSNWSIQVGKLALGIDLDDGYNGSFSGVKAVNREEACLFAFNTLKATMVEYDSKITANVNGAEVTIGNSKAIEVERNSGKDYTGNNESSDKKDSCGTQQFCEKYFSKLKAEDDTDDFGRPATKWVYDGDKVGTYADAADKVYVVADAEKSLATLMTDSDYLDYSKSDIEKNAAVYYNGLELDEDDGYAGVSSETKLAGKGDIIEVFENSDNNAETIVIRSYTFAKIDDVDDDLSSTLKNKGASVGIDLVDIDGDTIDTYYDDHDDGDKVLNGFSEDTYTKGTAIAIAVSADDGKTIIDSYVVESVTGEPSAARSVDIYEYAYGEYQGAEKGVKNGTITVGGTKYTYAAQFTGLKADDDVDFDKEYVVYLTAEGYALAVDGDATATLDDVYFVVGAYKETSKGSTSYYLQAISVTDGLEHELKLDKDDAAEDSLYADVTAYFEADHSEDEKDPNFYVLQNLYLLEEDDDEYAGTTNVWDGNSKYSVKGKTLSDDVTSSSTVIRTSGGRAYIEDTTFFISAESYAGDLDIDTATGMMSMTKSTNEQTVNVRVICDDNDAAFVIYFGDKLDSASSKNDTVYLTDKPNTKNNDGWEGELYFMNDMSSEDVVIDMSSAPAQGFYTYTKDSNGLYDLGKSKVDELTAKAEVTDKQDGAAEGVIFDEVKNSIVSSAGDFEYINNDGDKTNYVASGYPVFDAVSFSGATVIDTRGSSAKKADIYSNDITSTARLTAALDKGWVMADVYVEDGDIIFVAIIECENESSSTDTTPDVETDDTIVVDGSNVTYTIKKGNTIPTPTDLRKAVLSELGESWDTARGDRFTVVTANEEYKMLVDGTEYTITVDNSANVSEEVN